MLHSMSIRTVSRVDFVDITASVQDYLEAVGVSDGVCHVFVPHTTAGVTINEHADPSVVEDIAGQLDALAPRHGKYRHAEGNSPAHIKATLLGSSVMVLVEAGRLLHAF